MKKKNKKLVQSLEDMRFNSRIYKNYDLEIRLVQNINKETPLYSLD